MIYAVEKTATPPELKGNWNGVLWSRAVPLDIVHFRPEGSDHRPLTQARLLYNDTAVYGIFKVADRYVRCVTTEYQGQVCNDSCVEMFVQPKAGKGYFNLEFNCGGTMLCHYKTDPALGVGTARERMVLAEAELRQIQVYHSLPAVIPTEIEGPVEWFLEFALPLEVLERHVGPLGPLAGREWRGNFYKCADATSHPHWGSWSPVDERNFHLPRCFGILRFNP
jgi:hypothetical protein